MVCQARLPRCQRTARHSSVHPRIAPIRDRKPSISPQTKEKELSSLRLLILIEQTRLDQVARKIGLNWQRFIVAGDTVTESPVGDGVRRHLGAFVAVHRYL